MSDNPYEAGRMLADYLLFHYGRDEDVLPWPAGPRSALGFPRRSVEELIDDGTADAPADGGRALDVGCAVGRSCYQLAGRFDEVLGIDFSAAFIDAAELLRRVGQREVERLDEGRLRTMVTVHRPDGVDASRIRFLRGDAMALEVDQLGGTFDLVHAANLVCRLPEPVKFLAALPDLVAPGGQLLLTTPATWLAEFTPESNWPEGAMLDYLRDHLAPAFRLEHTVDLPMLIRETRRKYQWTMVQGSRWRRV